MFFVSFVAGLIFGVGSGFFEKLIGPPLRNALSLSDSELSILSFGGLMVLASLVVSSMGVDSSSFWMVLGGMLGAFAIRAVLFGRTKMDERKALRDAAQSVEDTVDDAADAASETLQEARG